MANKKIIQICFSLKTDLTLAEVNKKLTQLKNILDESYGPDNYECHSCHLSRTLCENKGFSTEISDMFNDIFGNSYVCELESETDFNKAMAKLLDYRTSLAEKADKLVIIDKYATHVSLELKLFTHNRVMLL